MPAGLSPLMAAKRSTKSPTSAIIASNSARSTAWPAVPLGERHHADRQRGPGADFRRGRTAVGRQRAAEQHQFGRAAADVEQDHALGVRIDQRRAAGGGEPRLGLAVDDFERDPDLLADAGQELGPVGGGAAGFGRDQPRAGDAAVRHLVAADGERLDRARDRRLADAAGCRYPLAQPDDAGERVDDAEAVAGRARHQEPAIVGAEIERGIGRPPARTRRRNAESRTATADPIGTAAAAPGHARDRGRRPGPRPPSNAFPPRRSSAGSTARGDVQSQIRASVAMSTAGATDARPAHGAAGCPCRSGLPPLSHIGPLLLVRRRSRRP